jgi:uncharacterized tellurite resistance protein B-like protein
MPINYKYYPKDWPIIRQRILAREEHKCKHCQVPNYAVIERGKESDYRVIGKNTNYDSACAMRRHAKKHSRRNAVVIVLTIAHLDHDEWNHDVTDDRLAALCQRCHLMYDECDNAMRKKYGKHYKKNQISII